MKRYHLWCIFVICNIALVTPANLPPSLLLKPSCTPPQLLVQGQNPDIHNRTIVFSSGNVIQFYDLGPDRKPFTSDDRGIIAPLALQSPLLPANTPKMFGSNIIYLEAIGSLNPSYLKHYSLGPDGIAGTADDSGPHTLFISQIGEEINGVYVHEQFVRFSVHTYPNGPFTNYYCTLDDGGCQNGLIYPLGSSNNSEGVGTGNSTEWQHFFTNDTDIYTNFFSPGTQGASLFIQKADLQIPLAILGLFMLIHNKSISSCLNCTSQLVWGITVAPNVTVPFVEGIISSASVSKELYKNKMLTARVQRNKTINQYQIVVDSFPLTSSVTLSYNNLWGTLSTPLIDGPNVVFSDFSFSNPTPKIKISRCTIS